MDFVTGAAMIAKQPAKVICEAYIYNPGSRSCKITSNQILKRIN